MDLNHKLAVLLIHGNSLRSSAKILGLTYRNTYLKFLWLGKQAGWIKAKLRFKARELEFDEMETIHHTKCKPLSIALMVNENYEILSAEVAQMPAKGPLAEFSVKKYGFRKDERELVLKKSFERLQSQLDSKVELIKSDAKPSYRKYVKQYFPHVKYEVHSRVNKQRHRDRLHEKFHKKLYDPLFALNQRCALLRSSIRRLTRRSWCTTKKPENLQGHLDIFIVMQFQKIA